MKHKWRKGPPPSIGWWPASVCREPEVIRWWNGHWWSVNVDPRETAKVAAQWAEIPSGNRNIEWTDRWWEK